VQFHRDTIPKYHGNNKIENKQELEKTVESGASPNIVRITKRSREDWALHIEWEI
jgi:hypothetical protein